MDKAKLQATAKAMVADGKGILAADESTGTCTRRFEAVGVESNEATRQAYREMLFTAEDAERYVGGVILFDETLRQKTREGTPFSKLLADKGIAPGIKVDAGAVDLAGFPGEKVTEGLDGLRARLKEYVGLGARFTKWRAVITIGDGIPTRFCLEANAHALARYAALAQEAGLVPIVEPEVLMDGDHGLERCYEVTAAALQLTFDALFAHRVHLEGMLLKPNMVISGTEARARAGVQEVAEATVRCLREHVPAAVPGVVFLSGGQGSEEATAHLDAMNKLGPHPWALSFSYGRALQQDALQTWAEKITDPKTVAAAQKQYAHRVRLNWAAARGEYAPAMEKELVGSK